MAESGEDALEEAYERGLACEKAGDAEGAAAAYREVLRLDPEDRGGAAVRLAALGRGETPEKAPGAYVATLFDQHAEVFDAILVDQLGYLVPEVLGERLRAIAPGPYARLLDLGCGTGLSAEAFGDLAAHLSGLDLSAGMLEIAHEKELYDTLYIGDAVEFLLAEDDEGERWDLIVATDVMPYLGALEPIMAAVGARIAPGGVFGFSTETLGEEALAGRPYMVGPKQRFAHDEGYVRRVLAAEGFGVAEVRPIVVRYEEGVPVPGHLVIARAAG